MRATASTLNPSALNTESCRAWLASLSDNGEEPLVELDRLLRALTQSSLSYAEILELAEVTRAAHLAAIERKVTAFDARAFPMSEPDCDRAQALVCSFRLGITVYEHVHQGLGNDALLVANPADPHTGTQIIAFARALDYRARLLCFMQRLRIEVSADDWDALCLVAHRARSFRMADVPVPEPLSSRGAVSCRELFVTPVLIHLAEPARRPTTEFALIEKLARRWAARVSFRVGDALGEQNTESGPTVALSELSSVRLKTAALRERMRARIEQLTQTGASSDARLPGGMSIAAATCLMNELLQAWCEPRSVYHAAPSRIGRATLCFGFPNFSALAGDSTRALTELDRLRKQASPESAAWHSVAKSAYTYGQFEQESVLCRGYRAERADPLANWVAGGRGADWVGRQGEHSVFIGTFRAASIRPASLVMIQVESTGETGLDAVVTSSSHRQIGRILAMNQRVEMIADAVGPHCVHVQTWPGIPELAGFRVEGGAQFHDAIWLKSAQSPEAESLVLQAGVYRQGGLAVLRDHEADCTVRMLGLLDSGPGYERVHFSRISA